MSHQTSAVVTAVALALTLAACGSGSDETTAGTGPEKVTITSPEDGATVQVPFMLRWDSTVPLGPPDSGKDHVHVYVDGNDNDYTVVGANRFQVKDLAPGKHEVEISLQHADHTPVGAESSVEVTVGGSGGGSQSPSGSDDGGRGY